MAKAFKMRRKPGPQPVRALLTHTMPLDDGMSLAAALSLAQAECAVVSPCPGYILSAADVRIDLGAGYGARRLFPTIVFDYPEPLADFDRRIEWWRKEIADYAEWAAQNVDLIREHEEKTSAAEKLRKLHDRTRKLRELESQQRKLEKLKKELEST